MKPLHNKEWAQEKPSYYYIIHSKCFVDSLLNDAHLSSYLPGSNTLVILKKEKNNDSDTYAVS